jgi:uncharacterized protein YbjT (DUF2867 family)
MTNNKTDLTLVLGGTGKTGSRVAARLTDLGRAVRIGSRSGVPPFDWDDRTTWGPALTGATAAYITYYPDLAFPGAADAIADLAHTAIEHDVRRLVLLSGRGEKGAQLSEQALMDSGADWTIVSCAFFAQNFDEGFMVESVLAGEFALPAGDVREPVLHIDDIADVAVAALTEPGHVGQVYELTGPRLMTFFEVAAELSEAAGYPVRYAPITPAEFAAQLKGAGLPDDFADGLAGVFTEIMDGHNAHLTDGVQRALGRPPRDFSDYVRATAATGVWRRD